MGAHPLRRLLREKGVDGTGGSALSGAEFTLTDAGGNVIATVTGGEDGLMHFRELTKGIYTLTKTKVPDGYMDNKLTITVTITQNPVTMEYNIFFGNLYSGVGSSADPLRIQNHTTSCFLKPEERAHGHFI